MKASNLFLCVLFAAATIVITCQAWDNNNGTLGAVGALFAVLFCCAATCTYDDAKIAAKRRKRRATAVKMTGYVPLRGGGWLKIQN